jgi:hypothetical protein
LRWAKMEIGLWSLVSLDRELTNQRSVVVTAAFIFTPKLRFGMSPLRREEQQPIASCGYEFTEAAPSLFAIRYSFSVPYNDSLGKVSQILTHSCIRSLVLIKLGS